MKYFCGTKQRKKKQSSDRNIQHTRFVAVFAASAADAVTRDVTSITHTFT
jgi:hypothetical protein